MTLQISEGGPDLVWGTKADLFCTYYFRIILLCPISLISVHIRFSSSRLSGGRHCASKYGVADLINWQQISRASSEREKQKRKCVKI